MIGLSADDIFTTMIASGFAKAESAHEINLAMRVPISEGRSCCVTD